MERFQPDIMGYSLSNAYALTHAAELSYRMPDEITRQVWSWEFPQFRFLDCDTTQAYIMGNDRTIVVAFRGTETKNLQDWRTDLKAGFTPECGGNVHCGFQGAVNHIWESLVVTILQFRTNNQNLVLTGHSLGGALATLSAIRLVKAGQAVDALYSYGSPRVGNRAFRSEFNAVLLDRTFRFVNDEDGVARLPLKALGYCHVGQKFYFDRSGDLKHTIPSEFSLLAYTKNELEEMLDPDFEFFRDHDLQSYKAMILSQLDRSNVPSLQVLV